MRVLRNILLGLIVAAAVGGCDKEKVQVVDPNGQPVANVRVVAVGATGNAPVAVTNAQGWADVSGADAKNPKWMRLYVRGYVATDLPWPREWPARVTYELASINTALEKSSRYKAAKAWAAATATAPATSSAPGTQPNQ